MIEFAASFLFLLLTGAPSPVPAPTLPRYEIRACSVGVTELGRVACFSGTASYELTTDKSGKVTEVALESETADRTKWLGTFVRLDGLDECFKAWQLSASQEYRVTLQAGTMGELSGSWPLTICDESGSCLTVVLHSSSD